MLPLILRRPLASMNFLGRLGDDSIAVVVEPIDQRADGRVFLIFNDRAARGVRVSHNAVWMFLRREGDRQAISPLRT
jgi:hypothetical protein